MVLITDMKNQNTQSRFKAIKFIRTLIAKRLNSWMIFSVDYFLVLVNTYSFNFILTNMDLNLRD